MTKRTMGALALLLSLALVAAACGDDDGDGGDGGATTGGTYRMETDGIAYTSGGDPSGEYLGISFGIFTNLLARTLLTYYHTGGADGNSLVPDLAEDFPVVSEDGLTYTFTLKDGIMFGPPLSREITSHDIEFAFRRMAVESVVAQYEFYYDGLINGLVLQETLPDSIAGIETPDDKTIVFHLTRVSPDFVYLVAMPATAPQPEEVAGCFMDATYGRYVISSGPYMYEGTDELDASSCEALTASGPISGFDPATHSYFVRNPDYDPATDDPDVRANYVDRIEIDLNTNIQDTFAKIKAGELDGAVASGNPPADVLQDYSTDPELQDRLVSGGDDRTWYITMNLTAAPFDDIHVRRAANLIMDKAGILQAWGGEINGIIATHIQPPALSGLGADYDPYATEGFRGDEEAAKAEMAQSVYDTDGDGMCDAPECSGVIMINRASGPWIEAEAVVVASLAKIGITVEVREVTDHYTQIQTVANNIPIGMNPGWGKDYPDSSSFAGFLFDGRGIKAEGNYNYSMVGLTAAQAASLGVEFGPTPSVDTDIDNCKLIALTDEQGGLDCWNDLDKKLMEEIVPWVPYLWPNIITTIGPAVTAWDFDQFSGVTAFSKVAVDPSLQN
ncbi:MAG TPA: ABC transporter substrate-binding protein [Acidimicrobiia bacterium]|nr:ABC transporter substrate-binding protein [Acidimicrobiia bacterium]